MDSTFSEFTVTNSDLSGRIDSEFASLEREAILDRRDK